MKRIPVKSTDIVSIGYDKEVSILEVEFRRESIYQYANVPENVFKELMAADSIGTYFNSHIRDQYPNSQVS